MKNKFCTIFLLLFSFTSHAQESPPTNENTPTPCCHESPKPCGETCAEKPKWTLGGEARFRFETRDNRDLNSGTSDHHSFVGTRVRLNVGFEPIENLKTFVQPQFSHIWGQGTANVLGNGTLTPGVVNSGGVIDPTLNLHQAYVHWKIIQPFHMILGRQEMTYGDEIVIGPLGFSNVGRSFDAIVFRWEQEKMRTDFFYSKIADEDVTGSGFLGEYDFAGIYHSWMNVTSVDAMDIYGLYLRDRRAGSPTTFNFTTLGLRIKDTFGNLDYRLEGNGQAGEHLGNNMLAYMMDAEIGYTVQVQEGLRLGLEYNRASGDKTSSTTFTRYHQLFPTMHRWLGYMDLFGRQNMQSGILHANLKFNSQWSVSADLHSFWRVETQDVIYSIVTESPYAGQTVPPTSGKKHVGEEVDLVLTYNPIKFVAIKLMGGIFFPGAYFKSSVGNNVGYFSYLQTTFSF